MPSPVIKVENLSKLYRLGEVGTGSIAHDINRWWHRIRGKEDPYSQVGQTNDSRRREESDWMWALKDINFEVKQGEVLGIIGRNGAGKSTLLKILSRITAPSSGNINVRGRIASLLEVGTGFHPELSGRDNIFLNGAILGMTRAEIKSRFDEIVAFAEIEKFLDTPVKRYSSGMYVRLAFAVAAHLNPDILIVDEVLAVGDLAFQQKCLGKLSDVAHRSGVTVLFVSHQMSAVRTLCSRGLLLNAGGILCNGPVEQVLTSYINLSSSAVDASAGLPPPEANAPAWPTAIHVLDEVGTNCSSVKLSETWRVRLEFELRSSLPHLIAAIGLRNCDSVPVITWWSSPSDLAEGRYSVEFTCDLPLCAGSYSFIIGLSSLERTVYYADGVSELTISEIAIGEQPFRSSGTGLLIGSQRPTIQAL